MSVQHSGKVAIVNTYNDTWRRRWPMHCNFDALGGSCLPTSALLKDKHDTMVDGEYLPEHTPWAESTAMGPGHDPVLPPAAKAMIDLHTHTDESDGSLRPEELVAEAARIGLEGLAITDHDTLAGYDQAIACAARWSIDLVRGIELSAEYRGRSAHLLAYFPHEPPSRQFRSWISTLQAGRRKRNEALVEKLTAAGMPVTLEEVSKRGKRLVARPHFAALMVEKGYVSSAQQAFDEYLDESGACFVSRDEPPFSEAVARIIGARGIPVLAHPVRIAREPDALLDSLRDMCRMGLRGIEVYHSDHSPAQTEFYALLALKLDLTVTGGSDYHGAAKPRVALGTGIGGNVRVPRSVIDELRRIV